MRPKHTMIATLFAVAALFTANCAALSDGGRVPVLLYHPQTIGPNCTDVDTDVLAMRRDLGLLRDMGFTPVPARKIVEWRLGLRSGSTLPARPVVITTDDGHNRNYLRTRSKIRPCAADLPSVREVAEAFNAHVTVFVIASPTMRAILSPAGNNSDAWWLDAERHPLISIQSHTADHEHQSLVGRVFDPVLGAWLPAAGNTDGRWRGENNPQRWSNYVSADIAVARAGRYIGGVTGHWPDLLAHPFGVVSPYMEGVYLPALGREHEIVAAFCTEGAERFVSRRSPIFCLPRLTRGNSWFTAGEFLAMMRGAM